MLSNGLFLFRAADFISRIAFRSLLKPTTFLCVILAMPARAEAHLMNTGFGPFYDGLTHLFVTPEDLLQVIALALLAGLQGPRIGRAVLFALPAAWLIGTMGSLVVVPPITMTAITALGVAALGGLVAADRPLGLKWIVGVAIFIGLLNGALNGIELAKAHSGGVTAAGIACAIFVVVSICAGQVTSVHEIWTRMAVRVAGSWIAASGLFMFGWALRAA